MQDFIARYRKAAAAGASALVAAVGFAVYLGLDLTAPKTWGVIAAIAFVPGSATALAPANKAGKTADAFGEAVDRAIESGMDALEDAVKDLAEEVTEVVRIRDINGKLIEEADSE